LKLSSSPSFYQVRNQPDGRAYAQGCHTVLRLRRGETKGPLPQHALRQTEHQPGEDITTPIRIQIDLHIQTSQYICILRRGDAKGALPLHTLRQTEHRPGEDITIRIYIYMYRQHYIHPLSR